MRESDEQYGISEEGLEQTKRVLLTKTIYDSDSLSKINERILTIIKRISPPIPHSEDIQMQGCLFSQFLSQISKKIGHRILQISCKEQSSQKETDPEWKFNIQEFQFLLDNFIDSPYTLEEIEDNLKILPSPLILEKNPPNFSNDLHILFRAEDLDSGNCKHILQKMIGKSLPSSLMHQWPVGPDSLSHLTIPYCDYNGEIQIGNMIVHKIVQNEVLEIFKTLLLHKFPINSMKLIDEFNADDNLSMLANNSSGFCCRAITDKPGTFSKHSFGLAIDINPFFNPYIRPKITENSGKLEDKWVVYPEESKRLNLIFSEDDNYPKVMECLKGTIFKNEICVKTFEKFGWVWGGNWTTRKDFQHFEKDLPEILNAQS